MLSSGCCVKQHKRLPDHEWNGIGPFSLYEMASLIPGRQKENQSLIRDTRWFEERLFPCVERWKTERKQVINHVLFPAKCSCTQGLSKAVLEATSGRREQVLPALREGAPIGQFLSPVKKNALVTFKWTTCANRDAAAYESASSRHAEKKALSQRRWFKVILPEPSKEAWYA